MGIVYFSLGFIVALIAIWMYTKFAKGKRCTRIRDHQTIFDLVESSKDVIYHFEVKPEQKFKYVTPSIETFLGEGVIKEEVDDHTAPFRRIHPDDYENLCKKINGEMDYSQILIQRWMDNDGNYRWFEEYATPVYKKGELVAVEGILRNIDDKVKLQQDLEYRINHDTLTGIYNREYFEKVFTKYNEQINAPVAIALFDLDELKFMNDNFGHKEGDALIKRTAQLLNHFSSDTITVSRIGGDEFVLIIAEHPEDETKRLLNNILNEIDVTNESNENSPIALSTGFAFTSHSVGQLPKVLSEADKKMYADKTNRKQLQ
ncbi:MAG TPA: sensor domain-containing diguanylate cyclase, partial [Ureibacillus sp.]|nr:sensor domain-containing diguanylate cyclase [Ureibacillus sp.]